MPRSSSRNPDKDPAAALGKHLRRVRMAAGFRTQDALAVRLNVSSDLVSKVETGWHVPTEDIFLAWLETCGVGEEGRILIHDMWILARNNRGGFPEFFEECVTAEEQATFLRLYCLVGTAEVMAGQLGHLLEVSQRHNVIVQVVLGRDASWFLHGGGRVPLMGGAAHAGTGWRSRSVSKWDAALALGHDAR